MHDLLEKSVLVPLIAIVLMQSIIVMSTYGITIIAPDAAGDVGIPPEWIGYLFAVIYAFASVSGLMSGRTLIRKRWQKHRSPRTNSRSIPAECRHRPPRLVR